MMMMIKWELLLSHPKKGFSIDENVEAFLDDN